MTTNTSTPSTSTRTGPALPYTQFLNSPIFTVIIYPPRNEKHDPTAATERPSTSGGTVPDTTDSQNTSSNADDPPAKPAGAASTTRSLFAGHLGETDRKPTAPVASGSSTSSDDTCAATKTYTIHQSLLESVSAEMRRHLSNSMLEGRTHTLHLRDVHADTFERFVEWAYSGDYPFDDASTQRSLSATSVPSILAHARLFVFAERFNIGALRVLAKTRLERLLVDLVKIQRWADEVTAENVAAACRLLFEQLPVAIVDVAPRGTETLASNTGAATATTPATVVEQDDVQALLRRVVQFTAENIKSLGQHAAVRELVLENPEFALALVDAMGAGTKPGLTDSEYETRLSKEKWRCGRCFGQNLNSYVYRSRVYCNNCGTSVGITLAS